jgi:hypothetical protein
MERVPHQAEGKLKVRNHVKLTSCNHRFKDTSTAVETAESTSIDKNQVEVAVEDSVHSDEITSFHAEIATDGEEVTTAVVAADDTEIDWRTRVDGHVMAKRLKEIEDEESTEERTGLRSTRKQNEWREELKRAMMDLPDKGPRMYEKTAFDASPIQMKYEDFLEKAQWNFQRKRRPIYHDYGARSGPKLPTEWSIIDPDPISPAKLDGTAYIRASPTFIKVRLDGVRSKPRVGLLDNCAAISLIDARILDQMERRPTLFEREVKIKGVGSCVSTQFCIIHVLTDVTEKDSGGIKTKRRVRIPVELHVVDELNESFVIGMDVIGPYQINIRTSKAEAKIQTANGATFPIFFGPGMPRMITQEEYSVVATETITIPSQTEMTIKAMIAGQDPSGSAAYDLVLDPIPITRDGMDMLGVVGKGLYTSDSTKVWFANLGYHPITIQRGTKIATTQHVSSMDEITELPINHTAGGDGKAEMFSCVPKKATNKTTMGKLKDLYSTPHWSTYVQQYAFPAVLMDPNDRPPPLVDTSDSEDLFDVSGDFGESAKRTILETLRSNIQAFTLDGRPGRVDGIELELDTEDTMLYPEKLRQTSPNNKSS